MGRKVLRLLTSLGAVVCLSALLLAAGVRLDNYILRRRAEHLLADIRSLELRKSTYSDARKTMDRYGDNVRIEGPCQPYWCDALISLDNTVWKHIAFFGKHQNLLHFYSGVGGRVAYVRASIRVRNNIVGGKSFAEIVESGTCWKETGGGRVCLALIGTISTDAPWHPPVSHPEYEISKSSGCFGCIDGNVRVTPYAEPADILRLSDINLSCITGLHPCETQADILPSAWKEYSIEQAPGRRPTSICTQEATRALSRASERVSVGAVQPHVRGQVANAVGFRILKELKHGHLPDWAHEYPDYLREYPIFEPAFVSRTGDRYIAFFRTPEDEPQDCMAPATANNLRIVREGIAEDWSDPPNLADPPIGHIKPPHSEVR